MAQLAILATGLRSLPSEETEFPLPVIHYDFEVTIKGNKIPDRAGFKGPEGVRYSNAAMRVFSGGKPWPEDCFAPGVLGRALRFGGQESSQYLEIGVADGVNLAHDDLTISFWLKTEKHGGVLLGSTTTAPYWQLGLASVKEEPSIQLLLNGGEGRQTTVAHFVVGNSLADEQWHHLVLVLDRGRLARFYLDGKLAGSHGIRDHLAPLKNVLTIGGPYSYFEGLIDEFALFRGSYSQDLVKYLSQRVTLQRPSGLVPGEGRILP